MKIDYLFKPQREKKKILWEIGKIVLKPVLAKAKNCRMDFLYFLI